MSIPMNMFLQLGADQTHSAPSNKPTPNPQKRMKPVQESKGLKPVDKHLPGKAVPDGGTSSKQVRGVMKPIEYGSLIHIFDEYKGYVSYEDIYGIPQDVAGYPRGDALMEVDKQRKVLEFLLECNDPDTIGQALDLAMRVPCSDMRIQIVDKLAAQYQREVDDPDNHFDIPVMHYIDRALELGKKCADECGDDEAFKDICRLGDEITNTFSRIEKASQYILEEMANPNQRNLNELTPFPAERLATYPMYPREAGIRSTFRLLEQLEKAQTDEEITECMMILCEMNENCENRYEVTESGRLCEKNGCESVVESYEIALILNGMSYDAVMETSIGASMREAGRNARNAVRTGGKKIAKATASTKATAKKISEPMVRMISDTWEKAKKADEEERRKMIIQGGIMPKIFRWMKRSILILAGAAAGTVVPVASVITAIAFIAWICTDKRLDRRVKNQILKELDDEIEVCNEKIDDARGDASKEAKYKLIRIRNKLKRTQDRIRFNLKNAAHEDDIVTSKSAREHDTKEVKNLQKKEKKEDNEDEF